MKIKPLIALCAATLFVSNPAHSQMYDGSAYAFPVPDYVGPMLSSSILNSSVEAAQGNKKRGKTTPKSSSKKTTTRPTANPSSAKATAAQLAKLNYTPSAATTRKVNEQFAKQFLGSDAKKREQFLKILNSGQLQQDYRKMISQVGLSHRNLADATTAYLVTSWQIVHQQKEGNRKGILAERDKMQNMLARNAKIQSLSNAQKQEIAEQMQLMTMTMVLAYRNNEHIGDEKNARLVRQSLISELKKNGVDLHKIKMTDRGFVKA